MSALVKLIKAFGVNVEQQHIDAVEKLLPQIPGFLQQVTTTINDTIRNLDQRLTSIESRVSSIEEIHRAMLLALERIETKEQILLEAINAGRTDNRSDSESAHHGTNGSGKNHGKHRSDARNANRR